jgi:hypothetical protein
MTLHNLKIAKTFKIHCCQQHYLNFLKVMAPLTKNEKKKTPLLPMIVINRFEKSYGTLKGGRGNNPLLSTTLG